MSNHFSAANLKSPGGDPRLDFTDLFVFQSPSDQDKTVLISDYCPLRSDQLFNPDAVYRINIDNDGDAKADLAFNTVFSEPAGGVQAGTVYQVTGDQAREAIPAEETLIASVPVGLDAAAQPVEANGIKVFVGVRSDPFFADAEGAFHDFHWTGVDTFADKNVLTIALEVPSEMAAIRRSIRSSTPTIRKTSTTPACRSTTWRITWSHGRRFWRTRAATHFPTPRTH